MNLRAAVEGLRSTPGVIEVLPLEQEQFELLCGEESRIESLSGMPLDNKALRETVKRKIHILVFSKGSYEPI